MRKIAINLSRSYDALLGNGLLDNLGEELLQRHSSCKVALICDDHVYPLYAQRVKESLENARFKTACIKLVPGEKTKNLQTYGKLLEDLCDLQMTRSDLVVALGGGVIGDLCGFTAATYMRGMPFVQVPTTLLSAVDASVGGKTGVDLPSGKNMVGAFHQPLMVLCDTQTFDTLGENEWKDGAAECIKHALIADEALYHRLLDCTWREQIEDIVANNIEIKRSFVKGDEQDKGQRQALNFGHTIGHAIEKTSNYTISHGKAVAMGMLWEMRSAYRMGMSPCTSQLLLQALKVHGLPTETPYSAEEIFRSALSDKKKMGDSITLACLDRIGAVSLHTMTNERLEQFILAGGAP